MFPYNVTAHYKTGGGRDCTVVFEVNAPSDEMAAFYAGRLFAKEFPSNQAHEVLVEAGD